jgi:ATP-dependent helicase YprA (DUF1998 family)
MDVFDLDRRVVGEYSESRVRLRRCVRRTFAPGSTSNILAIDSGPSPSSSIIPTFKVGRRWMILWQVACCMRIRRSSSGSLALRTERLGRPSLYKHQVEAIQRAASGASYVVTTGTGSGKSMCFFIPIIDKILRELAKRPGVARA